MAERVLEIEIQVEQDTDERFFADIPAFPGLLAYQDEEAEDGRTSAIENVKKLARDLLPESFAEVENWGEPPEGWTREEVANATYEFTVRDIDE